MTTRLFDFNITVPSTGGTHNYSFYVQFRPGATSGPLSDSRMGDITTTVNWSLVSVTPPNLTVSSISCSPNPVVAGGSTTINYRVTNNGGSPANNFEVNLYIDAGTGITRTNTISLSNGAYTDLSYVYSPVAATPDPHDVFAMADANSEIAESNESDNTRHVSLDVTAPPNRVPVLSSGSVSPTSGVDGTSFTYQVTYTDADNDAPTVYKVNIDGTDYNMSKYSGTYSSGAVYRYTTSSLAKGSHNYRFRFNDGRSSDVYLPSSSTSSGPTVNNSSPSVSITGGPPASTTNTSATFTWSGSDPDGSSDISGYYYELDDSTPDTWTTSTSAVLSGIGVGAHTFYVKAVDEDGAASAVESRSFTVVAAGSAINVTVKKQDGSTLVSGAGVLRYSSGFGSLLETQYTNASGVAAFSGVPAGTYDFEVFNNGEFWGNPASQTVSGTGTYNLSFTRYMPYGESVTPNVTTLNLGETVRVDVLVWNKAAFANRVKVRLLLDRDRAATYDFDQSSAEQNLSGNSTATFSFNFTPGQAGDYYRMLEVQTFVNTAFTKTDSWDWSAARLFAVNVPVNNPPTISISAPAGGSSLSGNVDVLVTAIDPEDGALTRIEYYVDDVLRYTDNSPDPISPASSWTLNTTGYSNGSHTLKVIGYDSLGASAQHQISAVINNVINTVPGLTTPQVTPSSGNVDTDFVYSVTYTDADDDSPTVYKVSIDGTEYNMSRGSGTNISGVVYSYTKTGLAKGSHNYRFRFNDGRSSDVYLPPVLPLGGPTVNNSSPSVSITGGPPASTTDTSATFTWSGSDPDGASDISGYYYELDDSTPDTWTTSTSVVLSGIGLGAHTFYVKAVDGDGAASTVASRSFTVNVPVNNPPTISISVPAGGASLSGNVDVLVTAIDPEDGALTRIEYYVDDVLRYTDNSPDAMSPASSWSWNTIAFLNGAHTLKAIGYDSLGASAQHQISVTVNNVAVNSPPSAPTLVSPANTATGISIQPAFSWNASTDPDGDPLTYTLIVSRNSDLTSPVVNQSGITGTSYTLACTLLNSTAYYWRITADDGRGGTADSAARSFTTTAVINNPPTISISAPAGGASLSGNVNVLITAIDPEDGALTRIEYYVDDILRYTDNSPDAMSPASSWSWVTTGYANGSHTLKVIGYDSLGASAQHQISVTVNNVFQGNINLTVRNIGGANFSGAEVKRYSDAGTYLDSKLTATGGGVSWTAIPIGTYYFKIYNGEEYWGSSSNITIAADETASATFTRFMPYGELVTAAKSSFAAGESSTITVAVKNDASFNNTVKVELILDRSQSAPYDYDITSDVKTISGRSSDAFTFNFTAPQSGTYFRAIRVYSLVSGSYVLTDSWAFGGLDALSLILPTSEACGYLKFDYSAAASLDQVRIYIDYDFIKTEYNADFRGGLRSVNLSVIPYYGPHTLKLEGWRGGSKIIETSASFNVDNVAKVFLVGGGRSLKWPFAEDVNLEFHEVENYKLLVRQPSSRQAPSLGGINFEPVVSNTGYEYELPLQSYYLKYDTTNYQANYLHINLVDVDDLALPLGTTDKPVKVMALYAKKNVEDLKTDFGEGDDLQAAIDKFFTLVGLAKKLKKLPDKLEILVTTGKLEYDGCNYIANRYNGKYHLQVAGEGTFRSDRVKYIVEVHDADYFFKIKNGQVVKIYNFDDLLSILEWKYTNLTGMRLKFYEIGSVAKKVAGIEEYYMLLKEKQLVDREIRPVNGQIEFDGTSSLDESLDRIEVVDGSKQIKDKLNIEKVEIDINRRNIRDIGRAAEYVGKVGDLLTVLEIKDRLKEGNLKGAAEELAAFLGGTAGGLGGGLIGAFGGPGGAIAGSLVGGYAVGGATRQEAHFLLYGPESTYNLSIYPGEKANFIFNFQNEGNYPHTYKVKLDCPSVSNLELCYVDEPEFTLQSGEHHEAIVPIRFSTLNTEGKYPLTLNVLMDDGKYTWQIIAEVELKRVVYIPECPYVSYTPSAVFDPITGTYQYYCPEPYNVLTETNFINGKPFYMSAQATYSNVTVKWDSIPYFIPLYNLSSFTINRSAAAVDINVPNQGDTQILANYPATITIADFDSNYCIIKHNGTVVYENGRILDSTLIQDPFWDQEKNIFTFKCSHWDNYTIITDPGSFGPHIKSIKFDGKEIVEGDYVSSRPRIEVVVEDKLADAASYQVEINPAEGGTNLKSVAKTIGTFSAGESQSSVCFDQPLPEGRYCARVTVSDMAGNTCTLDSPQFKISAVLDFSALNGPNPFSPNGDGAADTTKISYQLSANAKVIIKIVSLSGQMVKSYNFDPGMIGFSAVGYNEVIWDGKDQFGELVANGLYLAYLKAEVQGEAKTAKLKIAVLK